MTTLTGFLFGCLIIAVMSLARVPNRLRVPVYVLVAAGLIYLTYTGGKA